MKKKQIVNYVKEDSSMKELTYLIVLPLKEHF